MTHLDDPVQAYTSLGEDSLDVLTALCCLVRDAAFNQLALVVCGDLAGDEDLGACDDGLGLFWESALLASLVCPVPAPKYGGGSCIRGKELNSSSRSSIRVAGVQFKLPEGIELPKIREERT